MSLKPGITSHNIVSLLHSSRQ